MKIAPKGKGIIQNSVTGIGTAAILQTADNFTTVPTSGPNSKLLAILNFETTGAADVTADGDHRSNQGITEQAITVNRRDILGPIYTTVMQHHNGQYETGAVSDEGYSLWNLGVNPTDNNMGVPTVGGIPNEMEIRSRSGVAEATRNHAVILNTNV